MENKGRHIIISLGRNFVICFVIVVVCCLHGCIEDKHYPLEQSVEEIVNIDVVYVSPYDYMGLYEVYSQNDAITTIRQDGWDSFLNGLNSLSYRVIAFDPDTYVCGYVIRIRYADDTVDFISDAVGVYYDGSKFGYNYIRFDPAEYAMFIEGYLKSNT